MRCAKSVPANTILILLSILGDSSARFVRVHDAARLIFGRLADVDPIFLRLCI